jgi:hypothetical protein
VTLPRRTPLKRGGPLPRSSMPLRRAPLVSTSVPARKPMRRKPAERSPEEIRARKLVAARSGGICEGCGRAPATEWAHRVGRAQGGPWCSSNGLHLCSSGDPRSPWGGGLGCHEWSHHAGNRVEAESIGWMLRRHHNPATTPALLHAVGWVLLHPDGSTTSVERTAS